MRLKTPIFPKVLQCIMRRCRQSFLRGRLNSSFSSPSTRLSVVDNNWAIIFKELVTLVSSFFRLSSCSPLKMQHGQTSAYALFGSQSQSDRFVYLLLTGSPLVSKWACAVHPGTWSTRVLFAFSSEIHNRSLRSLFPVHKQWRIQIGRRAAVCLRKEVRHHWNKCNPWS